MNRQFYEFWGQYFTNAAKGQKQLEDIAGWMNMGFQGREDITSLFRRSYGLEETEAEDPMHLKKWQKAIADFQENFTQTAKAWGWVSQAEHQKARERCAELEKENLQQKATINQLRDLLNQEGLGHTELLQHFKGVFEAQSDQFHKLMKTINEPAKS